MPSLGFTLITAEVLVIVLVTIQSLAGVLLQPRQDEAVTNPSS